MNFSPIALDEDTVRYLLSIVISHQNELKDELINHVGDYVISETVDKEIINYGISKDHEIIISIKKALND